MNQTVVIDASVALKWILPEEFTDQARSIYKASLTTHRPIFVPPHFRSEVTSALYQRTRRGRDYHITQDDAYEALTRFSQFYIETLEPQNLYKNAFIFARDNQISSLYDTLYVVLAQMTNAELWTGDRRLFNSVGRVAPWVRFIGDY